MTDWRDRGLSPSARGLAPAAGPTTSSALFRPLEELLSMRELPGSTARAQAVEAYIDRLDSTTAWALHVQLTLPMSPLRKKADAALPAPTVQRLILKLALRIQADSDAAKAYRSVTPEADARYLDNVFESVDFTSLNGSLQFLWTEKGKKVQYGVALADMDKFAAGMDVRVGVTSYNSREEAVLAAAQAFVGYRGLTEVVWAIFKVPRLNITVPTMLTATSMPRLFKRYSKLIDAQFDALADTRQVFHVVANAIAPPGVQTDEYGNVSLSGNPLDWVAVAHGLKGLSELKAAKAIEAEENERRARRALDSAEEVAGAAKDLKGVKLPPVVETLIQGNAEARVGAAKLVQRGSGGLLRDIVGELGTSPKNAQALLADIGKLSEERLHALDEIRDALGQSVVQKGGGQMRLDWMDFYTRLPKSFRDEVLTLVAHIAPSTESGLGPLLGRVLRENPQDIQGSLGHLHAAASLLDEFKAINRGAKLRLEVVESVQLGGKTLLREVDIQVVISQRTIDGEAKTHLNDIRIGDAVKGEFAKDLVRHARDGWEDLRYLYNPQVAGQLGKVRQALLDVFRQPDVQAALRATVRSQQEMDRLTQVFNARVQGGLVGTYAWLKIP